LELANAQDPMLVQLGGGARDLTVRLVPTPTGSYVVAHLLVDVRDAMGANAVNSMAEAVAARVGEIAGGRVLLRILTNKADLRLARARAVLDAEALGGAGVVRDMVHAYQLAAADPYPRGNPQQGNHERDQRRGARHRQRHPRRRGGRALACAGRGRKVHVDVVVRARPEW
jgi:hydroxymethylglutaryl-CoA reductase